MKLNLVWLNLFSTKCLIEDNRNFKLIYYLDDHYGYKKNTLYWTSPLLNMSDDIRITLKYKKMG
jgi:hypothetical protein